MEPVVQPRAEDHHRLALGLVRVLGELPRDRDHVGAPDAGDRFLPGRRVRNVVVVGGGDIVAAQPLVQPVIGDEQVVDRGDQHVAVARGNAARADPARQHRAVAGIGKVRMRDVAEVGELHVDRFVMCLGQRQPRHERRAVGALHPQVPLARVVAGLAVLLLAPAKARRTGRHDDAVGGLVDHHGLPLGPIGLPERVIEIGGPHQPLRHIAVAMRHQPDETRHVGIAAAVIEEVGAAARRQVEFLQHHVAHRQRQGRVGALFRMQPDVAELRAFRIIGKDRHHLGAAIADLGHEVRVGCARLRHVRAPHHDEGRVVPVGRFGHVGLLAPGLRRRGRQVAIPVVEAQADAAQQRQVARAGGVGHHRHRRDRRETDHAIGPVPRDGMDVGGGDDLVDLVPARTDEAAEAAARLIAAPRLRVVNDRGPGLDRPHRLAPLAPQPDQCAAHQRVFEPVGAVDVPGIGGAAGTAARLVIGKIGTGTRIVGLLGFPCHDAALDIDFPGTGSGAIDAMRGAHDFVMLPALAITVLPFPVFVGDGAVAIGKCDALGREVTQAVEKMAHDGSGRFRLSAMRKTAATAIPRVQAHAFRQGISWGGFDISGRTRNCKFACEPH